MAYSQEKKTSSFPQKERRTRNYDDRRRGGFSGLPKNDENAPHEEEQRTTDLICGRNAVKELLASGRDIEKIYIQKGEREGSINLLIAIASERKIPIVEVERQRLDRWTSGARHQGIAASAAEHDYASLDDVFAYAESCEEAPFLVMCDGVEDPHNLGAILRSADCCGVHGVIIPKRRSVGLTATVGKCSAGAIEHVRVVRVPNLNDCAAELKRRGVWLYAADMGGTSLYQTDLKGSCCIVLGNEGEGISRLLKENCDFTVSIPLYGHVDSMNVSCAAAVILSEAAEQKHR